MLSGQALVFDAVLKDMKKGDSIDIISEKIYKNMIALRDEKIQRVIFDKFHMNFDFIKEVLMKDDYNDTISEIVATIKQFSLQTSVILAGFKEKKAQIFEISENEAINTRDINFDAIGSGGIQAINTLLFQRHSKTENLKTTVYNVYKAKRNSEVAVGVGKETDLFIFLSNGKVIELTDANINILDKIYMKEMQFGKTNKMLNDMFKKIKCD